jgi:hypothetical protein
MRDMLLIRGTPLHKLVENLLMSATIRQHIQAADIFEAEEWADNARGRLFEQIADCMEQRGEVVFEHVPVDDQPAWRCSLIISNEMMQFSAMGHREVYRRFVESIVDKVCARVQSLNTEKVNE